MNFRILIAIILCIASIFTVSCNKQNNSNQTTGETTGNEFEEMTFEEMTIDYTEMIKRGVMRREYDEYLNLVNGLIKDKLPQEWIPYDAVSPFGSFGGVLFFKTENREGKYVAYYYGWDTKFDKIVMLISHAHVENLFDENEFDFQISENDIDPQKLEKLPEEKEWPKKAMYVYKEFTYAYTNGYINGMRWEKNDVEFALFIEEPELLSEDLSREHFLFQFLNLETVEKAADSLIVMN